MELTLFDGAAFFTFLARVIGISLYASRTSYDFSILLGSPIKPPCFSGPP